MIVISGATGNVGSELVEQLNLLDVPFRALVRDPALARSLVGPEIELVAGDFGRPESLEAALAGAERLFLLCATSREQVELESRAVAAAAGAGVSHVVKLSMLGADPRSQVPYRRWHGEIEAALERSGLVYTLLRPTFYMQVTRGMLAPDGALYVPAGEGRLGWIDVRDVASAAVRVLTESGHEGRAYALSGPQSLGFAEVARKLSAASGHQVDYIDVPPDAAREGMVSMGMPEWQVEASLAMLTSMREGGFDVVSDDYERVVGVPPHSFDEFARDYAGEFQGGSAGPPPQA